MTINKALPKPRMIDSVSLGSSNAISRSDDQYIPRDGLCTVYLLSKIISYYWQILKQYMLTINGRTYNFRIQPVVGICMDGTSMEYYEAAKDKLPNLNRFMNEGSVGMVRGALPSFTNPNNVAIITGVPPAENGICGNYYYDRASDQEVMMNDPKYLTASSILSTFSNQDKKVGIVTAKDKLRRMLSHGLKGICFSAEFADQVNHAENGIADVVNDLMGKENPGIYDPEISVYCIEAGAKLLERSHFDLMYLTTTDFVQHKYAPEDPEAIDFLSRIDHWVGKLDQLGAIIGVTADHGMNAKTNPDGSPKVQFIETILAERANITSRVILPITDPYVVHHGALGSYATVYLADENVSKAKVVLQNLEGVELILTRDEAATKFNLPSERIGELVVFSDKETVIGRSESWHDLEKVNQGLRSHGGIHESIVPLIINRPLRKAYKEKLVRGEARNFDLFDFLLNGAI